MNGGFGLVLDGTSDADRKLQNMLFYDVNNGIGRRSWARNSGAEFTAKREMDRSPNLKITMPNHADDNLINSLF